MSKIVFIHGLNTFGDDDLHIGPLKFGKMSRHLESAFRDLGIDFVSVEGLGHGSAEDQANKALIYLKDRKILEAESLVLFGQSVGGLVARVMATHPELKGKVRKILTIGTPHHGAPIAEMGIEFEKNYPTVHKITAALGYDTRARRATFSHFTPSALKVFNLKYPLQKEIPEYSLLCCVRPEELSIALRPFSSSFSPLGDRFRREPSDGFIFCESQKRGEVIGPFALDHYAMLGYFFHFSSNYRERAKAEFSRMVATVAQLISG